MGNLFKNVNDQHAFDRVMQLPLVCLALCVTSLWLATSTSYSRTREHLHRVTKSPKSRVMRSWTMCGRVTFEEVYVKTSLWTYWLIFYNRIYSCWSQKLHSTVHWISRRCESRLLEGWDVFLFTFSYSRFPQSPVSPRGKGKRTSQQLEEYEWRALVLSGHTDTAQRTLKVGA